MGRWLEPHEPWPRHSRPYWRKALTRARSSQWRLYEFSAHSFGKVACRVEPSDDRCELTIFSTGNGSESVANTLITMLDRCPHRKTQASDESTQQALRNVEDLLDSAERLLGAATAAHQAELADSRVRELLDLAYEALDAAGALEGESGDGGEVPEWIDAVAQQEEADTARHEADEAAAAAGTEPGAADGLAERARETTERGATELKEAAGLNAVTRRALRQRVRRLRAALDVFEVP